MSGVICAESAFVELQVRVVLSPVIMVAGLALIVTVGAGWVTVTVACAVAVPPGPVAVRV